jgi:hypothetical protein
VFTPVVAVFLSHHIAALGQQVLKLGQPNGDRKKADSSEMAGGEALSDNSTALTYGTNSSSSSSSSSKRCGKSQAADEFEVKVILLSITSITCYSC